MTTKRRRTARHLGSYDDADVEGEVMRTDAVLDALARREPVGGTDAAIRLLGALVVDVDGQWLSSVSITPST
ncbi:anti-sigma-D factor RsdA [Microbispora bryophytorum]|uniref:anti-sigma-D factor RsdA n=1 Tax=Microbispora bryophytorum TaxID=1460882 RepID=UPI0033C72D73